MWSKQAPPSSAQITVLQEKQENKLRGACYISQNTKKISEMLSSQWIDWFLYSAFYSPNMPHLHKHFFPLMLKRLLTLETNLGLGSCQRIFGMQTGAARDRTTNLLIGRWPSLSPDLSDFQEQGSKTIKYCRSPDLIGLNTGNLTRPRHGRDWQLDSYFWILWVVVHGCS